jgi:hypothetical protein
MRWLAIWLLLAGVYLPGVLATRRLQTGRWSADADLLARAAAVPAVQTAALAGVAAMRRRTQEQETKDPRDTKDIRDERPPG